MANGQPALAAPALFARLSAVAASPAPNALEVARIRQEARRLISSHADSAHQILGAIAALEFNIGALHEHHRAAINLASGVDPLRNYATSLQCVGLMDDASKYALMAAEKAPENLSLLRSAIEYVTYAGKFQVAAEYEKVFAKRAPKEAKAAARRAEVLLETVAMLEHLGIDESEVTQSLSIAFETIRNTKTRFSRISVNVEKTSGHECVGVRIYVHLPAAKVLELDRQLGKALAERLDEMHSGSLVVDFGSTEVHLPVDERPAAIIS